VNPFLSRELAGEHIRDLREEASRGGRADGKSTVKSDRYKAVSVRLFAERDIDAIRRLAALDEKPVPTGGVLVAEEGEELVAALPLDGGPALADPFKPTADIVELLRLRARQLEELTGARPTTPSLSSRLQAPLRRLA
jgi:hypothetical protein